MASVQQSSQPTRERILEAAGEVFAEVGFRNATVRDICGRAGANLAAVNYYFRDKAALYTEVLDGARACSMDHYPSDGGLPPDAPAEERLRAFVRAFIMRLFDRGRPTWHAKLISREMVEPTAALDMIVQRGIAPQFAQLRGIVAELIGAKPGEEAVVYAAASVVGQCLHHYHCRAVMERLVPELLADPRFIDNTSAHIAQFSLHALAGMRRDRASSGLQPGRELMPAKAKRSVTVASKSRKSRRSLPRS